MSTTTDTQMRSDMEALTTRLVQTERALMDTRQQVAAVPKVAAPLVETRTSGKAPTFTGGHKDWPEWSFQFTAYMESANPKSIEALRWAAVEDSKITAGVVVQQSFEEHTAQQYLALAMLCKGSALNIEVSNGLGAWRGLNATTKVATENGYSSCYSRNVPSRFADRWECDVREYEQRFGKTLDENAKRGVILALAPLQVQNHCHLKSHILNSYAQVRTMLLDYCRAQADTAAGDAVPMDLSMLG